MATQSSCSCKRMKNPFKSILPNEVSNSLYFEPTTVNINSHTRRYWRIIAYRQICLDTSLGCVAIACTSVRSSSASNLRRQASAIFFTDFSVGY